VNQDSAVRWGWLRGMYVYTIVGAGGVGLGILLAPKAIISLFGLPSQEPITFGITGSVYLAFALLSVLGLRSPLEFAPILLLQLTYKTAWLIGVIIPALIAGTFPGITLVVVIYLTYIAGDLIAIPFSRVLGVGRVRAGRSEVA
jgi:hypothetical protein